MRLGAGKDWEPVSPEAQRRNHEWWLGENLKPSRSYPSPDDHIQMGRRHTLGCVLAWESQMQFSIRQRIHQRFEHMMETDFPLTQFSELEYIPAGPQCFGDRVAHRSNKAMIRL
jgi:hypothetical protein